MLGLFGARLPIDAAELEFQLATFRWLGEEFGRRGRPGCLVALIRATPAANVRARQIADRRARAFRCGRDEQIREDQ